VNAATRTRVTDRSNRSADPSWEGRLAPKSSNHRGRWCWPGRPRTPSTPRRRCRRCLSLPWSLRRWDDGGVGVGDRLLGDEGRPLGGPDPEAGTVDGLAEAITESSSKRRQHSPAVVAAAILAPRPRHRSRWSRRRSGAQGVAAGAAAGRGGRETIRPAGSGLGDGDRSVLSRADDLLRAGGRIGRADCAAVLPGAD